MITTAIFTLAYTIISGLIGLLPTSTGYSSTVTNAITTIGGYFGMFSPIIPLGTLGIAVAIVFGVEIAIFGWKTFKNLIAHLPQIGGSGH